MKQLLRGLLTVLALLVLGMLIVMPPQNVHAAPPRADKPGYTVMTSLTADPKSNVYTASFSPDVASVYAWALVVADKGAAEKQYQVDVQFTSPLGSKVDSKWYSTDSNKITTISKEDYNASKWGTKNVARRQLDVAGTPNADMTGQWTVTFSIGGKSVAVENFTLATADDIATFDKTAAAKSELEQQGYTVDDIGSTTWDDGTIAAYVMMPMVSATIYSSETSKQLIDGYTALSKGFPNATRLIDQLEFSERYIVRYDMKVADWAAYVKSNDFAKFVDALWYSVWDKEKQEWLSKQGAKDFIKKNFGAGSFKTPPKVDPKQGTVGSIRVEVSPSSLPADGFSTAQVTVTVYDKKNTPLPNSDLTFTLSGAGTIKPKAATTDKKGQATATFTAGTKTGTATITATVGKTTGTAVVTLGEEESPDPAADNVRTFLVGQGYSVRDVKYDNSLSLAWVTVDLGVNFDTTTLAWAILNGLDTLRENYPNASRLSVVIPYQQAYLLAFGATATDVDRVVAAVKAAKSDKTKINAVLQSFISYVFDRAIVLDAITGEQVSTFKDLTKKKFGF